MGFIPQMEPWFGDEEKEAIYRYMDEGGWVTEFKKTTAFEEQIREFTGSGHCIVVNNGTISLTLMAMAAGIGYGDEVLVPNYTMIATPNSIKMLGAVPVFVDVERETLCMDIELARRAITPRTKAILFVNANGRNPKSGIDSFRILCEESGLILLEDSAQSLGSYFPDNSHQGTKSLAGSFSFSAPKIISTGQGGAIVTNDQKLAEKIRKLKDFGRSGGGNDIHDSIGYNFKFTDIQACIGIEQMKKLPFRVKRKKEIYQNYKHNLSGLKEVTFFEQDLILTTPWFIDVLVERREDLMLFLKNSGIGTRVMYPPINKQVAYQLPGEFPVSTLVGETGLWLPSQSQLLDTEIDFITTKIIEFYSS
jgi:perosamine synthetase